MSGLETKDRWSEWSIFSLEKRQFRVGITVNKYLRCCHMEDGVDLSLIASDCKTRKIGLVSSLSEVFLQRPDNHLSEML